MADYSGDLREAYESGDIDLVCGVISAIQKEDMVLSDLDWEIADEIARDTAMTLRILAASAYFAGFAIGKSLAGEEPK